VQRWILKAVIHDDDAGAAEPRRLRAGDAVPRHDGRGEAGEEERLVADIGGAMDRRIDLHRAGEPAAIATA
jgi:hypothetical protein